METYGTHKLQMIAKSFKSWLSLFEDDTVTFIKQSLIQHFDEMSENLDKLKAGTACKCPYENMVITEVDNGFDSVFHVCFCAESQKSGHGGFVTTISVSRDTLKPIESLTEEEYEEFTDKDPLYPEMEIKFYGRFEDMEEYQKLVKNL